MAKYLYQQAKWPDFQWDEARILPLLGETRYKQGRLIGQMESLGFDLQEEATLSSLTEEIIKSSEIEGEILDAGQVRSSIAKRMGIEVAGIVPSDRQVDGVVEMMLDATQNFQQPLTEERLFSWHSLLFPTARSGFKKIVVGNWRNNTRQNPMQVVSGPMGRETVHFQAPDSEYVPDEMKAFIKWFNAESKLDSLLKAAMAHLWFVTIHPFEDGNGRIARTIADMQLARSDKSPHRFYSMSAQIRMERNAYYDILEQTQKGSLDITEWMLWFLICLDKALEGAKLTLVKVLDKAKFWERFRQVPLNDRQIEMINKLLDGIEGKLTTSKWSKMVKTSPDTSLRDIQDLIQKGILIRIGESKKGAWYEMTDFKVVKHSFE